jgi:hypothetical protein
MLLVKVVADEGHLNLDAAERAREVLPQLTIFCNKQIPKDIFSVKKKKTYISFVPPKNTTNNTLIPHYTTYAYHPVPLLEKDQYERIRRLRLIVYPREVE